MQKGLASTSQRAVLYKVCHMIWSLNRLERNFLLRSCNSSSKRAISSNFLVSVFSGPLLAIMQGNAKYVAVLIVFVAVALPIYRQLSKTISSKPQSMPAWIENQMKHNRETAPLWDEFASHRATVTSHLVAALHDNGERASDARKSLSVLGAGNSNDLDLPTLLRTYDDVHLVDIDAQSLQNGVRKQLADVLSWFDVGSLESRLESQQPTQSAASSAQSKQPIKRIHLHGGVDISGVLPALNAAKEKANTKKGGQALPNPAVIEALNILSAWPGPRLCVPSSPAAFDRLSELADSHNSLQIWDYSAARCSNATANNEKGLFVGATSHLGDGSHDSQRKHTLAPLFDVVASVCTLSQIVGDAIDFLEVPATAKEPKTPGDKHKLFPTMVAELRNRHLLVMSAMTKPGSHSLLISDMVSSLTAQDLLTFPRAGVASDSPSTPSVSEAEFLFPLMQKLAESSNFFHGNNPFRTRQMMITQPEALPDPSTTKPKSQGKLKSAFHNEKELPYYDVNDTLRALATTVNQQSVKLLDPWRWWFSPARAYLVYGIEYQRRATPATPAAADAK